MATVSWAPAFLDSLAMRAMYVRLAAFQNEMYFSMHWDRQVSSLEDMEEPGAGTQASKQCSLTFYTYTVIS